MSKREYLSALAMQGLLANPEFVAILDSRIEENFIQDRPYTVIAAIAISHADALIAAMNNPETQP